MAKKIGFFFLNKNTGTIRQDQSSCVLHKGDSLVICIAVTFKLVCNEWKLTGSNALPM